MCRSGSAPPRGWAQHISDMPSASVAVPPTLPGNPPTVLEVHQARQYIDRLAVKLRIVGSGLENVTVSLRSPRGEQLDLDDGAAWAGRAVWQAHYPTTTTNADLEEMHGWQPDGAWGLLVENGNGEGGFGPILLGDNQEATIDITPPCPPSRRLL